MSLKWYSDIPYHNKPHHVWVCNTLQLFGYEKWSPMHRAWQIHDILHPGTPRKWDEEISAKAGITLLVVGHKIYPWEIQKIQQYVLATVFADRGKIHGEGNFIADADLYPIGSSWPVYTQNAAKLFVEHCLSTWNHSPTYDDIMKFWTEGQDKFFSYLTSITGHENRVYITDKADTLLPYFPSNREELIHTREKNPHILMWIIQKEWKKYFGKDLIIH
jgi:hypothetical protein